MLDRLGSSWSISCQSPHFQDVPDVQHTEAWCWESNWTSKAERMHLWWPPCQAQQFCISLVTNMWDSICEVDRERECYWWVLINLVIVVTGSSLWCRHCPLLDLPLRSSCILSKKGWKVPDGCCVDGNKHHQFTACHRLHFTPWLLQHHNHTSENLIT